MTEFPQHGWVLAFSGRYCWREQAQRRHHSKNTHVLPPARTQSKRTRRSKAILRARKWCGSVPDSTTYTNRFGYVLRAYSLCKEEVVRSECDLAVHDNIVARTERDGAFVRRRIKRRDVKLAEALDAEGADVDMVVAQN
jgi:hypothetical protein